MAGDLDNYVKNPEPQEVFILGLQQIGASVKFGKIKILPIFGNVWAKDSAPYWVSFIKPDVFITLMDVWVFPELNAIGQHVTWCPYLPLDSTPLPNRITETIKSATINLPFSDFGVSLLEEAGFNNIFKIPHGYDANVFKRLPEDKRKELRKNVGVNDKFVIMSIGMNVGFRKGFPRLMRAFKLFNDKHKDTLLWLHTDAEMERGIPLREIAKKIGLIEGKNLVFTPNYGHGTPYPENRLNELINIADIHVLATMGEGFGLPIIESMGAGIPNVITDFSTTREFVGNEERGLAAKVNTMWTTPLACQQAMVDIDSLYQKMNFYYEKSETRKAHSKKAEEFVKKKYEWSVVLPKWNELLDKIKEMK